ncbi:MAG: MotA/TolQ/ExbB proton channel family protein [Desulfovibrionaceae bacterium]
MNELISDTGILGMLLHATLVVKFVLAFLVCMSIGSWGIIFTKLVMIGRAKGQVAEGYEAFLNSGDLRSGLNTLGQTPGSPLVRLSTKAVREFHSLEKADIQRDRKRALVKDTLRRMLRQGISAEVRRLSKTLSFLATCANAAPFIGLFGTVWGIMDSFHSIGQQQSAALTTVAPGISEALIATAIGLVTAIPATIAYNFFRSQVGTVESEMINFAGAFLNRMEREVSWVSAKSDRKGGAEDSEL